MTIEPRANLPVRLSSPTFRIGLSLAVAVLLVLPFWVVHFPPLIDYPNHLASVFVLAHLHDPNFHFAQYYSSAWQPRPYLFTELLLLGLAEILPISVAGKIVLSVCAVALPLSAWFFLRTVAPQQVGWHIWPLLIALNPFLLMGFLAFNLGIAVCFAFLALWLRYLRAPAWRSWLGLMLLALGLYFTHLIAFLAAGFVVLLYPLLTRQPLRVTVASWVLFVPGVILNISFSARLVHWRPKFVSWPEKLLGLPTPLLSYSHPLDLVILAITVAAMLALLHKNPELRWHRAWLILCGGLCIIYFLAPSQMGLSSEVDRRLLPFAFVFGLAGVFVGRRARRVLPLILVLFVVQFANVMANFVSVQPLLEAWDRSFSALSPGCRLLPMVEPEYAHYLKQTQIHFASYAVIERGCTVPSLFAIPDIHPLKINDIGYVPREQDDTYMAPDWPGVVADYDYVWAYGLDRFDRELQSIGDVVYARDGLKVYRLRKSAAGSRNDGRAGQRLSQPAKPIPN